MQDDNSARLSYAHEAVALLWPQTRNAAAPGRLVLLPHRRAPRLLVPSRPRRAAANAVIRYTAQQPFRDRMSSAVLAGAIWAGALSALPAIPRPDDPHEDAESIDDLLSAVFDEPVVSVLSVTSPRANRKPVLQAFDRSGRTLAFVKVGTNELTRRLVDHEAATLRRLEQAGTDQVDVPTVLHHGDWRDSRVLVMSALAPGRRIRGLSTPLDTAMRLISEVVVGDDVPDPWQALRQQAIRGVEQGNSRIEEWLDLFERVCSVLPVEELRLGAWHGDWTEWNCASRRDRVAVWDWERFATGVPLGFDRLHFVLNHQVEARRGGIREAAALVDEAPTLLAPWRITGEHACATAALYILQLSLRYLIDGARPHSLYGRVEEWAYPAVRASLTGALHVGGS